MTQRDRDIPATDRTEGTAAWHRDLAGPGAATGPSGSQTPVWEKPLHHVKAGTLDPDTAQTPGMQRFEALSARHGGTEKIWLGENHVGPHMNSGDPPHGEAETGIYVVSGPPEFVFLADGVQQRIQTGP